MSEKIYMNSNRVDALGLYKNWPLMYDMGACKSTVCQNADAIGSVPILSRDALQNGDRELADSAIRSQRLLLFIPILILVVSKARGVREVVGNEKREERSYPKVCSLCHSFIG